MSQGELKHVDISYRDKPDYFYYLLCSYDTLLTILLLGVSYLSTNLIVSKVFRDMQVTQVNHFLTIFRYCFEKQDYVSEHMEIEYVFLRRRKERSAVIKRVFNIVDH